ncbi:uncharacterized protein [Haliotis cracherodii]|uniref:uncharacterized protein n=1 Tax=Haliotis cracherodii TaxID=6455 RepID=UPI0039ED1085
MGSPLSPIITEIYITDLEEKALQTSPVTLICWFRKVDGSFVIALLNHLNAQHPRMQFTMESESKNKLPFLDVRIQKDHQNKTSSRPVSTKPTHTDQYLRHSSNHPPQVKRGIISILARRAKNISSTPQLLEAELNHLRTVFTSYNNYPVKLANQTINSTLNTSDKPPRQQTTSFVISLPYIGTTSHKIRRLLKHEANIDVVREARQFSTSSMPQVNYQAHANKIQLVLCTT